MKNREALSIFFLTVFVSMILFSSHNGFTITGNAIDWSTVSGLTSTWQIEQIDDETGCGEGISRDTYQLTIKHDKNKAVLTSQQFELNGEFTNNVLKISGSFPDEGGITTLSSSDLLLSNDCKSISGTARWTWKQGGDSCDGTSEIKGARTDSGGCPAPACMEDWKCDEWSACSPEGKQMRTCTDANACGTSNQKLPEEQGCTYTAPAPPKAPTPAPEKGPNYALIGGIVTAVLIAAGIIWHLLNRNKVKNHVKKKRKIK